MRMNAFGCIAVVLLLILILFSSLRVAAAVIGSAYTDDVSLPTRIVVQPAKPVFLAATATRYVISPGGPR